MSPFSLSGRRALVTGAGRGIGAAVAAALARAGAHVTLMARSADEIEAGAQAIRDGGGSAEAVPCDVTDLAAFRAVLAQRKPFDVFVGNAGTNRPAPFPEVTEADFDAVVGLNLRAAFFNAQAAAKRMIEGGVGGSIVTISSQMGHVGGAKRSVYCATKFAVEGMTKAMSLDLAPHNIRANTVCPTFIETPMTAPFLADPAFKAQTLGKIPLGRLGRPEDVTGAVLFLASDASGLVTGTSILVDGGWTAS